MAVVNRGATLWQSIDATGSPRAGRFAISRIVAISLFVLVGLGLVLRVYVARQQPLFVDEAFSLLAIQAVGERGVPLLPTGTPYLHGATLSYLLAPLTWFGLAEPEHLVAMRVVSAVAGAVSIFLTFRLALLVGASGITSLFAAALIAVDPASVEWGGYLRMYALAQTLALGVALLFLHALLAAPESAAARSRQRLTLVALVLVFWLAVFTHLATSLLWPAMALVALFVYRAALWRERRDVAVALLACLGAPAMLIALNSIVGLGAGTKILGEAEGVPGVSFLGDDKVQFGQMLRPDPAVWFSLFGPGPLENLIPLFATFATGLLVAVRIANLAAPWPAPGKASGIPALLVLYWIPIVLFAFLAGDTSTRYGLFLIPFGAVLIAAALRVLASLIDARPSRANARFSGGATVALILAALLLLHGIAGSSQALALAISGKRDLTTSLRYVHAHRAADEPVITVIPPPMTAIILGDSARLVFLPGGEQSLRARRYTRITTDGQVIDYWLGIPALTTSQAMCSALAESPGGWLVVSDGHWRQWGFSEGSKSRARKRVSELQEVISGTSDLAFEDRQGRVFRIKPADTWSETATFFCHRADKRSDRTADSPD